MGEFFAKHKALMWGGVAVVGVVGALYIYGAVGNSGNANATQNTNGLTDQQLATALQAGGLSSPVYSSGYSSGTDSGSVSGTDSTLTGLISALQTMQSAQQTNANNFNTASLGVEQQLGMANIASNQTINLANINQATTSTLATLASQVNQSIINAKATNAASGVIQGGGQTLTYTAEQVSGNPKYNVGIEGPNGTISLANTFTGQQLKG